MTEPEDLRGFILVAAGAGISGVLFLLALFAVFAEQLGTRLPTRAKLAIGILNLLAAAWWGYVSAVYDGLFVASMAVQAALGFTAILAARRRRPES